MFERVKIKNDPIVAMIVSMNKEVWPPTQEKDGIVLNVGFNFHLLVSSREWDDLYRFEDGDKQIPAYGVCDSVEQFLEKFGDILEKSPHKYAVGFTHVLKADQPPNGGWRWHKWGPYIGTHEPQHEYLYYEDGIEGVWTFIVLRKK